MSAISHLLAEIDGRVLRDSAEACTRTLARVIDLFLLGADRLGEAEVAVFDDVIQRFAAVTGVPARVALAGRLAPLATAPPGTILLLARDEIVVARPVLAGSKLLDDQALMAIALDLGRDHMLAICDRPALSSPVTDVLVSHGDGVVRHAVAGNHGARFSPMSIAALIGHAGRDEALVELLRERRDLDPRDIRHLVAMAEAGRCEIVPPGPEGQPLGEAELAGFAGRGEVAQAISCLATLTGLPPAAVERILAERDNDLLLVLGRARGWSWETIQALAAMRAPDLAAPGRLDRPKARFEALDSVTAIRVLHFVKLRENAAIRPQARADQHLTKVR